jgi:uncharacterized membrane protein YcgQ (UPF0703/DUF1980 family)
MFRDTGKQKTIYWFTISWDGFDEYSEGSMSFPRNEYDDAVDGIKYYLKKYKNRDAYLSGFAMEDKTSSKSLMTPELIKQVTGE